MYHIKFLFGTNAPGTDRNMPIKPSLHHKRQKNKLDEIKP